MVFLRIFSSQALPVRSMHLIVANSYLIIPQQDVLAVANLPEKLSVAYIMAWQFKSVNRFNSNFCSPPAPSSHGFITIFMDGGIKLPFLLYLISSVYFPQGILLDPANINTSNLSCHRTTTTATTTTGLASVSSLIITCNIYCLSTNTQTINTWQWQYICIIHI